MAGSRWLVVLTGDLAVRKPFVDCSYEQRRGCYKRGERILEKRGEAERGRAEGKK
jgi:hypothetical protein